MMRVKGDNTMKSYRGGDDVDKGFYLNLTHLRFQSVLEKGRLEGDGNDTWHQVPLLAVLAAGPVLGLLYAIFLPFIGFAMLGWATAGKVREVSTQAAHGSAHLLRPAWQPLRAFFSRGKPARKAARDDEWAEKAKKDLDDQPKS
jgi:hypothetical protein